MGSILIVLAWPGPHMVGEGHGDNIRPFSVSPEVPDDQPSPGIARKTLIVLQQPDIQFFATPISFVSGWLFTIKQNMCLRYPQSSSNLNYRALVFSLINPTGLSKCLTLR